jgi:hypothetical protein
LRIWRDLRGNIETMMMIDQVDQITGRQLLELVLLIVGSRLVLHLVTIVHLRVGIATRWWAVSRSVIRAARDEMIVAAIPAVQGVTTAVERLSVAG